MGFEQIISGLPAGIQDVLRQIYQNGGTLTARELQRLLYFLLGSAGSEAAKETIIQALIWLANAGRISIAALVEAAEYFLVVEEAEAAAAAAEAVELAGGGALAAAEASALVLSVAALIGLLIVGAVAYIAYSSESKVKIKQPPSGIPCAISNGPKGVQKLSVSRIGSRTSRNAAVEAAQSYAAAKTTCSGTTCSSGKSCQPVAIIISAIPKWRLFWTTTDVRFIVGCKCI